MHSTMVPEQVKTHNIQAGVQVSRLEDKDVIFSIGSAMEDFISLYFVFVRNIAKQWLDLKFSDHRKVDSEVMQSVVSTWLIRRYTKQFEEYMKIKRQLDVNGIDKDMECDPTNIKFVTWLASKFSVITGDLPRFKTYEDYKNTWLDEWNSEVPWADEKPWLEDGTWKEPIEDISHVCKLFHFKSGHCIVKSRCIGSDRIPDTAYSSQLNTAYPLFEINAAYSYSSDQYGVFSQLNTMHRSSDTTTNLISLTKNEEQWLDLKFGDHRKVDSEVIQSVVSTWLIRSYKKQFEEYIKIKRQLDVNGIDKDMECDPTNFEFATCLASKFRLKDLFHFDTSLYKAFKDFNYLLQIDVDVLTGDLPGFKTYEDYKNTWLYEWNSKVPWVDEKSWLEDGTRKELIKDIRMIQIGDITYFQDYEWYEGLEDGELKEEALKQKVISEGSWGYENRIGLNFCAWMKKCFGDYPELDYKLMTMLQKYWWGIKEEESSDDAWSYYSPITDSENYEHTRTINDDTIQVNQEWFDECEPNGDNEDDIKDLDDYLIRDDAPLLLMKRRNGPRKEGVNYLEFLI
ncbi:hypothetical protein Tco_0922262 [Tanacetum coccineum]|uniref:Uncharacterized protein n=1 Tax=Tanacetum coccineum TaxID=301880 RepID=A0ABQ5D0W3_9ASTR